MLYRKFQESESCGEQIPPKELAGNALSHEAPQIRGLHWDWDWDPAGHPTQISRERAFYLNCEWEWAVKKYPQICHITKKVSTNEVHRICNNQ